MPSRSWTAAELGRHWQLPPLAGQAPVDAGFVGPLMAADDVRIAEALTAALGAAPPAEPDAWGQAAGEALRRWLGVAGGVVLTGDAAAAADLAVRQAMARSGRTVVLAVDPLTARPHAALPLPRSAASARIAKGDVAAVLFEPRVEVSADADELRAVLAAARAHGTVVIADERRTAGRVHAASSAGALGLDYDVLLLGDAVACGRPFGALLARAGEPTTELASPPPDALALTLALATASALARQPVHAELAAYGERMARALAHAVQREQIAGSLLGPRALARFHIAAQEGVPAPLLQWHFAAEMQRFGAQPNEWCVAHALWPQVELRLLAALEATVGRLRTLLIESNSYLSGGLPFVFATDHAVLRQRGLARYRYPKRAEVDVDALDDRVRIAFAAGPIGPIVSSGFFVPTHLHGDFVVEAEYELRQWSPGPDAACFGLFFQNDLSTGRYYAQRTIAREGTDVVHGSFDGVLTPVRAVQGRRGTLRLRRVGRSVTVAHREPDGDWHELGRTDQATADDGIVGAKIWTKQACDGLVADITALRLEAVLPAGQAPPVPSRQDPRRRGAAP